MRSLRNGALDQRRDSQISSYIRILPGPHRAVTAGRPSHAGDHCWIPPSFQLLVGRKLDRLKRSSLTSRFDGLCREFGRWRRRVRPATRIKVKYEESILRRAMAQLKAKRVTRGYLCKLDRFKRSSLTSRVWGVRTRAKVAGGTVGVEWSSVAVSSQPGFPGW